MKKTGLVLLAAFLILANPSIGQEKEKGVMIKKIFTVLAQKDEEGFVNLFPDAKTIKAYMLRALTADTANADEANALLAAVEDSSMQQEFREDFYKYILMGEENGVDWSKAKLVSYTADSILFEEYGMETSMLKGKIYFNVDTAKYFLAYDEVIWFDNKGWYGVSIDRVDLIARENEKDVYDWDGKNVDSTLQVMDSVVAATIADSTMTAIADEIPVPKKKTDKQKPEKNKSFKKKSESPALKPE